MNHVPAVCRLLLFCLALLAALASPTRLFGYTKSGKTYTTNGSQTGKTYMTDGSQSDVNAAITNASAGDTVSIPAGTFTWGVGGAGTVVNKAITLAGASRATTIINQASGSGGLIYAHAAGATIKSFTVNQSSGCRLLVCDSGDGWRFTDLQINGASSGRVIDIDRAYGLIDHCTIDIYTEQIFMYGKTDAWTTDSTMGTAQAVYFEDCHFTGSPDAYTDSNANGKMVFRNCLLDHLMKFDAHGVWSDTPAHSSRHIEVYNNHWTALGEGYWTPIVELRGGTARIFNNTVDDNTAGGRGVFKFWEYGTIFNGGSFGSVYQTPLNYPVLDQVGRGKNQQPEPAYVWGNRKAGGVVPFVWSWQEVSGSSDSTIPNGFPMTREALEYYRANIGAAGTDAATDVVKTIGNRQYTLTGAPTSSQPYHSLFTMRDIIAQDRDYFAETYVGIDTDTGATSTGGVAIAFDGSTGVGIGTKAQMLAVKPKKNGVGFWVTDEGNWNSTLPTNTSGQLYTWNGNTWVLTYTPYTYPYPFVARPNPPTGLHVK